MTTLLEMRGISKSFAGVKALNDVNFTVRQGEIHALVGENGAGKSTLMKVLSGVYPHGEYDGSIVYEGAERQFRDINDSEALGIIIIHQELALIPLLSIAENIFIANPPSRFGVVDRDAVYRRSQQLLAKVGLNEAPDPDARLNQVVGDLSRLRHVSIIRQSGAGEIAHAAERAEDDNDPRSPPAWFVALVHPEQTSVSVPISIHGKPESLMVTSHPNDEMAEIWDGILTQLEVGSAIAIVLFLITMVVVGRALAPLGALSQAMTDIEAGSYDARVEPGGAPELADICSKLNHLAVALGDAVEDKRRLAERAVALQDLERKEIARELHDEFGPYLFAMRAHASALVRLSDVREPGPDALRKHGGAILEQVNAVQQFNRRILEKLRPVGLAEFGLRESLGALFRLWGESHPEVTIETSISRSLGESGETVDLTIYRVVQDTRFGRIVLAESHDVPVIVDAVTS